MAFEPSTYVVNHQRKPRMAHGNVRFARASSPEITRRVHRGNTLLCGGVLLLNAV